MSAQSLHDASSAPDQDFSSASSAEQLIVSFKFSLRHAATRPHTSAVRVRAPAPYPALRRVVSSIGPVQPVRLEAHNSLYHDVRDTMEHGSINRD